MSELNDYDAIELCKAGGEAAGSAFRVLFERYFDSVSRHARRVLGEGRYARDVDDAVQETFLRLHHSLEHYDPCRPLRPYLLAIAHNVCVDLANKRRKTEQREDDARIPEETSPEDEAPELASKKERNQAVQAALLSLVPEVRSLLVLRYINGLNLDEMARILGCTDRTVRNRLRSAAVLFEQALANRGLVAWETSQ